MAVGRRCMAYMPTWVGILKKRTILGTQREYFQVRRGWWEVHLFSKQAYYGRWWDSNSRPKTHVLPSTPFVEALVRWATGKRLTHRLPKLSQITWAPLQLSNFRARAELHEDRAPTRACWVWHLFWRDFWFCFGLLRIYLPMFVFLANLPVQSWFTSYLRQSVHSWFMT